MRTKNRIEAMLMSLCKYLNPKMIEKIAEDLADQGWKFYDRRPTGDGYKSVMRVTKILTDEACSPQEEKDRAAMFLLNCSDTLKVSPSDLLEVAKTLTESGGWDNNHLRNKELLGGLSEKDLNDLGKTLHLIFDKTSSLSAVAERAMANAAKQRDPLRFSKEGDDPEKGNCESEQEIGIALSERLHQLEAALRKPIGELFCAMEQIDRKVTGLNLAKHTGSTSPPSPLDTIAVEKHHAILGAIEERVVFAFYEICKNFSMLRVIEAAEYASKAENLGKHDWIDKSTFDGCVAATRKLFDDE